MVNGQVTLLVHVSPTGPTFAQPLHLSQYTNLNSRAEVNVGIIVVSAPVVTPFFSRYIWPLFSRSSSQLGSGPHKPSNEHSPDASGGSDEPKVSKGSKPGKAGKEPTLNTQQFIEMELGRLGKAKPIWGGGGRDRELTMKSVESVGISEVESVPVSQGRQSGESGEVGQGVVETRSTANLRGNGGAGWG